MGYAVQNLETGEIDFIYCDNNTIQLQEFDEETGEPLTSKKLKVRYGKSNSFHIPRKYYRGPLCEEFTNEIAGQFQEREPPCVVPVKEQKGKPKKQPYFFDLEGVKNDIILGHNKKSYILFFLPSLVCFNIYAALAATVLEFLLHIWAHKKNDFNMNNEIFFRSPLHVLTSQFCATCRSEDESDTRIFTMLNKQLREARTGILKDVSKVIT